MKAIFAEHRNAQASPNSAGSPARPAGVCACRSCTSLIHGPVALARDLLKATAQAVGQERAGQDIVDHHVVLRHLSRKAGDETGQAGTGTIAHAQFGIGDITEPDVMLTMRPNFRSIMPSMTDLIRKIGASMLASTAVIHMSRSQSRKSPRGGPPLLFTRISGAGHAASAAARPSSLVMSPATGGDLGAGQLADFRRCLL